MSGKKIPEPHNPYSRRKVQPRIRFRLRYLLLIFILCILIGLIYYMVKVNL
jgi:hypothetical protein